MQRWDVSGKIIVHEDGGRARAGASHPDGRLERVPVLVQDKVRAFPRHAVGPLDLLTGSSPRVADGEAKRYVGGTREPEEYLQEIR
ncbi:hypothetical protein GF325_00725 [Candidatus Bathyarchaeota archaeon]|nr:hypothetical protein [Candidatus Bathyarchaeota archaeon]